MPEAVLTNKAVRGVTLRIPWQQVEPVAGSYNWSYFDNEIARVAPYGKVVSLWVVAGGQNTPSWVMALPGVETIRFIDRNPYHRETVGKEVVIPVFWDRVFLEKKQQLFKAFGERFGTNPHVGIVGMSCANAMTADWNMQSHTPGNIQAWQRVGYTAEKMLGACKQQLDMTAAFFPGKVIAMPIGGPEPDKPRSPVVEGLVEYAYAHYPGRILAMRGNLSAKTPTPKAGEVPKIWHLIFAHRPYVGGQMLWFVTRDATFRMNGKLPGAEKEIFRRALQIGLDYGMSVIEVYQQDLVNPDFADITAYAALELTKVGTR